jgi:hypothetical protein
VSRKGVVVVQHKVKDFDFWRPFFVNDSKRQRRATFTRWRLARSIDDPNNIVIVFECRDLDKAKKVYSDPAVAEIVKKAGVKGKTTFLLVEEIESRDL